MLTKLRSKHAARRLVPVRSGRARDRAGNSLEALAACWPAADASGLSPAPSCSWIRAAHMAFAESSALEVFAIERNARITAATALIAARQHGVWRWMPPGRELGEPTDLAGQSPEALDRLAAALVAFGQPIVIDRMPVDSPAIGALRRAAWGRAIVGLTSAAPSRGIRLDDSWTRPARHLAPLTRRLLTRAQRRSERIGPTSVEIHTPDLRDLPKLLDVAFATDAPLPLTASDEALALRLSGAVFLRQYAEAACAEGSLRIGLLRIGDRMAAVQVGVETGEAFWLLKAGESPRFARCQPGQLLAVEMLSYAAQANLKSFELWGTPQPWMRPWPVIERPCVRLNLYPVGLRGAAALAADVGAAVAHAVRSRIEGQLARPGKPLTGTT